MSPSSSRGRQLDDDLLRGLDGLHIFFDGTHLPRHRPLKSGGWLVGKQKLEGLVCWLVGWLVRLVG